MFNSSFVPDEHPAYVFNRTYLFDFEKQFDANYQRDWMLKHGPKLIYCIGIYLLAISTGREFMKSQSKAELKLILGIWNTSLAIFSIIGLLRTFPMLLNILVAEGLGELICNAGFVINDRVTAFWSYVFALSKIVELCDTIFIVLRKHKLNFLHWYHHITVLPLAWYCCAEFAGPARIYMVMNYFVHSLMYSYYALRTINVPVPKLIAQVITLTQILQMIGGCYVSFYAFFAQIAARGCGMTPILVHAGMVIYFSYFILFIHFFSTTYLKSKRKVY